MADQLWVLFPWCPGSVGIEYRCTHGNHSRCPDPAAGIDHQGQLCDDARTVVSGVAAELGLPWTERQIDGDEDLTARFGEEVPVVLVDGIERDFWHIDPVRLGNVLRQALTGA